MRSRLLFACCLAATVHAQPLRQYLDKFQRAFPEEVVNAIPDAQAETWLRANIPYFTCPDPEFESTWYYRWWALRKHLKQTPQGWIFTEFLKPVRHASDHNAISCAFGHHVAEARWLHNGEYLDAYARFWLTGGENGGLQRHFHQFSGWAAAALWERYLVNLDRAYLTSLLDALRLDYRTWEIDRMTPSGLFWQRDVSDGMEESASGGRRVRNLRPTINSYMYGNAHAIAGVARLAARPEVAREYDAKADALARLIRTRLWNPKDGFFETVLESGAFAQVREITGFTPWLFEGLAPPEADPAWRELMNPDGFQAPYGPTTCERRSPHFQIAESGDDCQWNGPSWPFSTTVTLKALANHLHSGEARAISKQDYFKTLQTYTLSQRLTLADGRTVPFIDENLNPLTGVWWARHRKLTKKTFYGRGDHYNHSGYADLIITGLVGLRPRADSIVEVDPLLPEGVWDWFNLEHVRYHGHDLAIRWDKRTGLRVLCDNQVIAHAPRLQKVQGRLPE